MSSIRCPICDERLASENGELSPLLANHLLVAHEVRSPLSEPPIEERTSGAGSSEGGRLHQAELRREEQFWAPPAGTPIPERPEGLGDWVKKAVGTDQPFSERGEWTSGEGYPTMMDREGVKKPPAPGVSSIHEEVMDSVACPLCGKMIDGKGEDALTIRYREHASSVHHLVLLVRSPVERR